MSDLPPSSSTSVPDPLPRIIRLRSSDGRVLEVTEPAASLSSIIKGLIESTPTGEIHLPNIKGRVLEKVKIYLEEHYAISKGTSSTAVATTSSGVGGSSSSRGRGYDESEKYKAFDESFVREVSADVNLILNLIMAAKELELKSLMDLCCRSVADMIKGKTPEEIRAKFGFVNDFTPEEEEANRKEIQWMYE